MSNSVKITNLPIRKVSIGRPGVCSKLLCLIGILAKLLTTDIPEWSIVQIRGSYNLVLFHSNRNDDAIVIAQVSLHTTIALCSFEPLSLWSLILRFVKVLNKPKSEGSICFCHKRGVLKNTIATYRKMQKCNRWNFNSLPCKKLEKYHKLEPGILTFYDHIWSHYAAKG